MATNVKDFAFLDTKTTLFPYAAGDADGCLRLLEDFIEPQLKEEGALKYWKKQTCELSRHLVKSELLGFKMDVVKMKACEKQLVALIERDTEKIKSGISENFNPNSSLQMREYLFEELKLTPLPEHKTKKGFPGTSQQVLEHHFLATKNKMLRVILEQRKFEKLLGTYIHGFQKFLDPQQYVHTSFNLSSTVTGRVVSTKPALTTVPRDKEYAVSEGEKLYVSLREMFICEEDEDILYLDISGFQLRLLAILADDPVLLHIFETGGDPHDATARTFFETDYVEEEHCVCLKNKEKPCQKCVGCENALIRERQRDIAKRNNFGIAFGSGATHLSQLLDLPVEKVKHIRELYLTKYPGIKRYMNTVPLLAEQEKSLTTPYGRTRHFPEISTKDKTAEQRQWRQALNFLPQALEADLMIESINLLCREFEKRKMKSWLRCSVYDSVLVVSPKEETELAKQLMIAVFSRKVSKLEGRRFSFNLGVGDSWYAAEKDSKKGKYDLSLAATT